MSRNVFFTPQQVVVPSSQATRHLSHSEGGPGPSSSTAPQPQQQQQQQQQQQHYSASFPPRGQDRFADLAQEHPSRKAPGPLRPGMEPGRVVDKFFSSDPDVSRSVQSLYERRLNEARRLLDNLHLVRSRCESSRNHFLRVERDIREERRRVEEDVRMRFEALKRHLEDTLEVTLRQLDNHERELLEPVEDGNSVVDELYQDIERVSENLQLKFQVEAKAEFIHNFHLIQKDVDRVMAVDCPQVRLPNLSYLAHDLAFSRVRVVSDGENTSFRPLLHPGEALLRDKERRMAMESARSRGSGDVTPSDTSSSVAGSTADGRKKRRKRRHRYDSDSKEETIRLLTKSCKELLELARVTQANQMQAGIRGPEIVGRSLGGVEDERRADRLHRQQQSEAERISRELAEGLRRVHPSASSDPDVSRAAAPRDGGASGRSSMRSDYTAPQSSLSVGSVEDQIHSLISEATHSRSYTRTPDDSPGSASYPYSSQTGSYRSGTGTEMSEYSDQHHQIMLPSSEGGTPRRTHSRMSSVLSGTSMGNSSMPSVEPTFRERRGYSSRTRESEELGDLLRQAQSGRYTPGSLR